MAETNPSSIVTSIANGYVAARCLQVVAELGVADALDDAPMSVEALAAKLDLKPGPLNRVLRLLAYRGVFERRGDGSYAHTPASRLLRSDNDQYIRSLVRMGGERLRWASYGELEHTLRTGAPALEKIAPNGMWKRLAEQAEEGQVFNEAMTAKSRDVIAAVLDAYDFSQFGTIADIGGGRGHILAAILNAAPNLKGVLFDQPHVLATITASERMTLQPGNFFNDDLPVCDAYLIVDVLHNWSDEESIAILKSVRRAAPAHAKLLVSEILAPDDSHPHSNPLLANTIDIHMMVYLNGRKRTQAEFAALFDAAGFRLERVIQTPSNSIVEGVVV